MTTTEAPRPGGSRELGGRLRRYRRERGWTQAQLARKAKLSAKTISRIERGLERPLERTARTLARSLGVEAERLLGLEGQPVLFPHPDERRVALVRRLLALPDDLVEEAHELIDRTLRRLDREPRGER